MITITVVAYIVISLRIAHKTYWRALIRSENWPYMTTDNDNFMNLKRSLLYGFFYIPKQLLICSLVVGITAGALYLFIKIFLWVIINLP